MTLRAPTSRLLPATVTALALLLCVKSVDLVLAAIPGHDAPASGGGPSTSASRTVLASLASGSTAAVPAANAATLTPTPTPTPAAGQMSPAMPTTPANGVAAHGGAASSSPMPAGSQPVGAPAPAAKSWGEAPPVNEAERKVLLELRARREELDRRDASLATREAVLAAAEHKLEARIDELQTLQKRLEALDSARRDREEAGWQGLVKTYEAMKPRDAAAIFNDLDMPVLLQVVDRMKEGKAAPVLAAMQVEKARALTGQLAQMRAKRTTAGGDG